ncbi:hypothetical protein DTO212C5_2604 [Paecilomyces variotii]|nr:hypothetical protein DTO212C5_2604 [Paecilomyces variotii]
MICPADNSLWAQDASETPLLSFPLHSAWPLQPDTQRGALSVPGRTTWGRSTIGLTSLTRSAGPIKGRKGEEDSSALTGFYS